MGAFVDKLDSPIVHVGDPWGLITDRFDEVHGYAVYWADRLSSAVDDMEDKISLYSPDFGGLHKDIPEIGFPSFPDSPATDIDLNDSWPDTNIPSPPIVDPDIHLDINAPVPPVGIDPDFNYTPGTYTSCVGEQLCKLIQDEMSGGTGLSDVVYGLILSRNKEARRRAEDNVLRDTIDAVGSRGFNLPGGMVSAAVANMQREVLAKDIDAINSITIKDFEIADSNSKFIKELSLKFEEYQRGSFDTEEARLFEIAKAVKDTVIAVYSENIKKYVAEWEGEKTRVELKKAQLDAVIATNESRIKEYIGKADIIRSQIMAISEENRAKSEVAKVASDVYSSKVKAFAIEYDSMIKRAEVAIDEYKVDVQAILGREEVNVKNHFNTMQASIDISKSMASVAAQSVASALGAINTNMSFGYTGSTSKSHNSTLSNSLNESHSYQEE